MRTKRYFAGIICWLLLLLFGNPQIGLATEYVSQELPDWQEELDEYDFTQLEKVIRELLPDDGLTFRQITEQLLAGDMTAFCQEMGEYAKQILWGQMVQGRQTAWQVLLLAVAGAVFTNLARAFPDSGVSQSGFYVMYMLLAVLLLSIFSSAVVIAVEALTAMGRLMSAFLPVFFLIVAVQGQLTAAAMYECSLLLLRGIQWLYCRVITSGIRIWVLLRIIEGIFAEDMLTHLTEMLGKGLKMSGSGFSNHTVTAPSIFGRGEGRHVGTDGGGYSGCGKQYTIGGSDGAGNRGIDPQQYRYGRGGSFGSSICRPLDPTLCYGDPVSWPGGTLTACIGQARGRRCSCGRRRLPVVDESIWSGGIAVGDFYWNCLCLFWTGRMIYG